MQARPCSRADPEIVLLSLEIFGCSVLDSEIKPLNQRSKNQIHFRPGEAFIEILLADIKKKKID